MNASGVKKLFGSTQNRMRSTKIKDNTRLRPFSDSDSLNAGYARHVIFDDNYNGPFWQNELKRIEIKHDQDLGLKFKELLKKDLIANLDSKNTLTTGTASILKECCRENDVEWRALMTDFYDVDHLKTHLV